MKKQILTAAIIATSLLSASANADYVFFIPIKGMEVASVEPASNEVPATWDDLLVQYPSSQMFSSYDFLEISNESTLVNLPTETFTNTEPAALILKDNSIADISPLSSIIIADEIDLSGNNFSDLDGISYLEEVIRLDLSNNADLVDISGLSDNAGGAGPWNRLKAIYGMEDGIHIDAGISSRSGFVAIDGSSHMCNVFYADVFRVATQEEVCESTWN